MSLPSVRRPRAARRRPNSSRNRRTNDKPPDQFALEILPEPGALLRARQDQPEDDSFQRTLQPAQALVAMSNALAGQGLLADEAGWDARR